MELENIDGMMKFRRDISSKRLFCNGVPVSSKRCSAYREPDRNRTPLGAAKKNHSGVKKKKKKTTQRSAYINSHKMPIAQRVHVLQHVAFIKNGIYQPQLTKQAAVAVVSYCQVITVKKQTNEIKAKV